jgi:hypothetical protein
LVKALLGKPFSVAGEMLGDQMYAWRIGRLLRVAERTSKLLADSGIEARQLPTGPLIPLLEACASSASDEISDIFGNLLASAVADDEFHHPFFRSTLSQMCGDEARIISAMAQNLRVRMSTVQVGGRFFDLGPHTGGLNLSDPERCDFYVENLRRLNVIDWELEYNFTGLVKNGEVEGPGLQNDPTASELVRQYTNAIFEYRLMNAVPTSLGRRLVLLADPKFSPKTKRGA